VQEELKEQAELLAKNSNLRARREAIKNKIERKRQKRLAKVQRESGTFFKLRFEPQSQNLEDLENQL
jgi:hypothetical protein